MNKLDQKILSALQEDGRLSFTELGKRVGLTTTPCIERVRKLERDGFIKGYTALLNAEMLGLGLVVFVQVRLNRTSKKTFEEFRHAIQKLEEVQECYLVTGNFDFIVKARVKDMTAYRDFLEGSLLNLPGVQESTSIAVMETIKETLSMTVSS